MRFPATRGWGLLVVVVGLRSPLPAEGPGDCSWCSFRGRSLLVAVVWRCGVVFSCVVLWLATPALLRGPGVCVCVVWRLLLVWVVCGVRVWCACRVCVCACGVWFVGYVIPDSVRVVTRQGRNKRQKKRSCKCVARGWVWCYTLRFIDVPHYCPTLCVSPVESMCRA